MENSILTTHKINDLLKATEYKRWAFEFDRLNKRYCLSIFDNYNSDDEIVIYLHSIDFSQITHAIRYKGNGLQTSVSKKHYLYQEAETIISKFIVPNLLAT